MPDEININISLSIILFDYIKLQTKESTGYNMVFWILKYVLGHGNHFSFVCCLSSLILIISFVRGLYAILWTFTTGLFTIQ